MDKIRQLNSKEICAIIEAASRAGVTELNYLGLSLKFFPVANEIVQEHKDFTVHQQNFTQPPMHEVQIIPDPSTLPPEWLDEVSDYLDLVENPSAYEERITKGDS